MAYQHAVLRFLMFTWLAALAACSSTEHAVSRCEGAACAQASALQRGKRDCTLGAIDRAVGVTQDPSRYPGQHFDKLCLSHRLPTREDGTVECEARVYFGSDDSASRRMCRRFLHADARGEAGALYCVLPQVAGEASSGGGAAFLYTEAPSDECREPQRLEFVPADALASVENYQLRVHCEYAVADGDRTPAPGAEPAYVLTDHCSVPEQSSSALERFGQACEPPQAFADGPAIEEALLSTQRRACGSGLCLTWHLSGSLEESCDPQVEHCADKDAVRTRVACTCRCAADEPGDAELCQCPDGYQCQSIFRGGPAAGDYCVRSDLTTPP